MRKALTHACCRSPLCLCRARCSALAQERFSAALQAVVTKRQAAQQAVEQRAVQRQEAFDSERDRARALAAKHREDVEAAAAAQQELEAQVGGGGGGGAVDCLLRQVTKQQRPAAAGAGSNAIGTLDLLWRDFAVDSTHSPPCNWLPCCAARAVGMAPIAMLTLVQILITDRYFRLPQQ